MNDRSKYQPEDFTSELPAKRYGPIPCIEVGASFSSRRECSKQGVHAASFAGIHGSENGAYSICISTAYEDDIDDGEFIIYTGTGGQENSFAGSNEQVADQTFDHPMNASLMVSYYLKRPVRVVRGANEKSKWAPAENYRYDGLYFVEKGYIERGISGFQVCKFELRRQVGQPPLTLNPKYKGAFNDKKAGV